MFSLFSQFFLAVGKNPEFWKGPIIFGDISLWDMVGTSSFKDLLKTLRNI